MKKLISFVLIIILALPALVMAEDRDPIVGFWYLIIDVGTLPEKVQKDLSQSIHTFRVLAEVDVLYFNEKGEIYSVEMNFEPYMVSADDSTIRGTWTKNDKGEYNVVYKSRSAPAYFEDDKLFIKYYDTYVALRKMEYPDFAGGDLRN